jgi:hypothetical protein
MEPPIPILSTWLRFWRRDCDALYSGAQAKKKIWFEFMIEGKTSSLTNFVITYKND